MKRTVEAQTEEHQKLIEDNWKPIFAYQGFTHTRVLGKVDGLFKGHNLKPASKLYVVMEKKETT